VTAGLDDEVVDRRPSGQRPGLLAAGLHTFAASMVSIPIGFLASIVIARTLGPSNKGVFDLATASASLLALVLGFAMSAGITYAVARGLAAPRRVRRLVLAVGVGQAVFGYLLLVAADRIPVLAAILPSGESTAIRVLVSLLAAAAAVGASLKAILFGRERFATANWIEVAGRMVALVGVVLLVLTIDRPSLTPAAVISVSLAASIITTVVFAVASVRGTPAGGQLAITRGMRIAIPSYVANILQFLNYRLDLFLVAFFRTTTEVGLYALAATLAQMLWLVSNAMATVLFPRVASNSEPEGVALDRTAFYSRFSLGSALVLGVVLAVIAEPLMRVVYGPAYVDASVPIWLLLPGIVVFAPVNVLAAHLAGSGRPEINLAVSGASLVVTVVLDLVLIPPFGMAGAAIATSVAYTAAAVVTVALYCRLAHRGARSVLVPTTDDVRRIREHTRRLLGR
jgi:O-antigen/teichoic acid export membrane protein